MQIAICDDEEEIRDLLKRKITDLYPGAGLHVYGSGDELLKAGKPVDLLLLDIQIPKEKSPGRAYFCDCPGGICFPGF